MRGGAGSVTRDNTFRWPWDGLPVDRPAQGVPEVFGRIGRSLREKLLASGSLGLWSGSFSFHKGDLLQTRVLGVD